MLNRPKWILIVENEAGACYGLRQLLLEVGYRVLTCSDCSQSRNILTNQKFACVVIDHNIQGACGVSVIRPIKKNANHLNHNTPFILMSEQLEMHLLRQISSSIEAAFVKPVCNEQLVEKVKSIVPRN